MKSVVQKEIDELVASGQELGLQVAVYRDGEQIVDAVAGLADPDDARPVTSSTPFFSFSTGKAATAIILHRLVERGFFSYDTPVAALWPEFAAHGKDALTVRQVLNHSAGMPGLPLDLTVEEICDRDTMCSVVADSRPWWEPGSAFGYHPYTLGFVSGEVVRRATGKGISDVLREEITEPLSIADECFIGVPPAWLSSVARLQDGVSPDRPAGSADPGGSAGRLGPASIDPTARFGNRPDVLSAEIPSCATTSARAMARIYAAVHHEVDGVRLLAPEMARDATGVSVEGTDRVFDVPSAFALGFGLGGLGERPSNAVFGMGGGGGSWACGNSATGLSYAITKNRLTPGFDTATRISRLIEATP